MTITLTKEEISEFQSRLSEWYSELLKYTLSNVQWDPHTFDYNVKSQAADPRKRFEKDNPKPDWRSLL